MPRNFWSYIPHFIIGSNIHSEEKKNLGRAFSLIFSVILLQPNASRDCWKKNSIHSYAPPNRSIGSKFHRHEQRKEGTIHGIGKKCKGFHPCMPLTTCGKLFLKITKNKLKAQKNVLIQFLTLRLQSSCSHLFVQLLKNSSKNFARFTLMDF